MLPSTSTINSPILTSEKDSHNIILYGYVMWLGLEIMVNKLVV